MPRLSTFVYSESVQQDITPQGPRPLISGPQLVFKPMFIPSLFSFSVTIGVSGMPPKVPHTIRYEFKEPVKGEKIVDTGDIQIPITETNDSADMPEDWQGFLFNMDFRNVIFKSEGVYISEIFADGDKIGEVPIYVKGVQK